MPHRLFVLLLLCSILALSGVASGSLAEREAHGIDQSSWRPIENAPLAGTPENDAWLAKQGANGTALDVRGPEDLFADYKVGSTSYDYQHNGPMGRNIAQGADGRIHFVWMHKFGSAGTREIFYNSAVFSSWTWNLSHDSSGVPISGPNGGFGNIDVWGSLGVPHWHEGPTENAYSIYTGIDFSSGAASFTTSAAPVGATCSGATTNGSDGAGNYLWPIGAVDVGYASDPVFHAVGHESTTETEQSFVYFRGSGNPTNWNTCGIFVDSVTDIAGIVRQDPNSNEVAIVWIKPRDYGPDEDQYNNDLFYVKSSNGGLSWGTPVNITNHIDSDLERPYSNLSAIYTEDGCLHIAWDSPGYNQDLGTHSVDQCRMYHWDDCNSCRSLIIDADNTQACTPGNWNRNVSKMNLVECDSKLYVVYTYFYGDTDLGTTDCSVGGWANGEIYAQCSSTGGVTWGPPLNLTTTPSNGCTPGSCQSEHWSSTVMYGDSLYIFYVGDLDAGGIPQGEGTWTDNPMMFMVNPCFDMEIYVDLSATPNRFYYPIHVVPGGSLDTTFVLQNAGNTTATWNSSVTGASIVGSVGPSSGSVPAGCTNSSTVNLTLHGPFTEGLYEATIHINFSRAVQDVDIELYVFDPFCLPEHVRLRTNANLLDVAQNSRAANKQRDAGFAWFADTTNYLFDASLIIGNTSTGQWDFDMYHGLADEPTASNPWGRLYTTDCYTLVDTMLGGITYRYMQGTGVNHDSTIEFTSQWYCSGHPDSNAFYVGHFAFGPGPKFTGDIGSVVIAFGADWDIPSDTGSDNLGNVDDLLQCVYQKGMYPGSPHGNDLREAGIAYRGHDDASEFADGGLVWDNPRYVHVANGYHVDTLQNRLPGVNSWFRDIPDSSASGEDLNSIIVIDNNAVISSKGTNPEFNIVLYAINPNENPSATRESILEKADEFICNYISPGGPTCGNSYYLCNDDPYTGCDPGDANGDGTKNITDAVWMIQWIFSSGQSPRAWTTCSGDANGDCLANITDAVVIIQWIFAGGPAPLDCLTWTTRCPEPGTYNPGPWGPGNVCEIVSFAAPILISECQEVFNPDGSRNVHTTFEMDAAFKNDCECCEYRQYVKGFFWRDGEILTHVLEHGVTLDENVFKEDGSGDPPPAGANQHYGHRNETYNPIGDQYSNPLFRATGCDYDGWDSPGQNYIPASVPYLTSLEFQGQIIDVCNGNIVKSIRSWQVVCGEVAKLQEYPAVISQSALPLTTMAGQLCEFTLSRHENNQISAILSISDSEPVEAADVDIQIEGLVAIEVPPAGSLAQTWLGSRTSHAIYKFAAPENRYSDLRIRVTFRGDTRTYEMSM